MKFNGSKTAMICMSGAQSYNARFQILGADGQTIQSRDRMKVLGFHFSGRPTVHAHVDTLCRGMRRRFWVLYHLKKAGFSEEELARVYRICILPVVDYCSVVYHSLLTDLQDQQIERLQASALRCIYGFEVPYSKMREKAGATTLRQRRVDSTRFLQWFPLRSGRTGSRRGERYQ